MEEEFYRKIVKSINNARAETEGTAIGSLISRAHLSTWGVITTHHEPAHLFIYELTSDPWKSVNLSVSQYRPMSEKDITANIIAWVEKNVADGNLTPP